MCRNEEENSKERVVVDAKNEKERVIHVIESQTTNLNLHSILFLCNAVCRSDTRGDQQQEDFFLFVFLAAEDIEILTVEMSADVLLVASIGFSFKYVTKDGFCKILQIKW